MARAIDQTIRHLAQSNNRAAMRLLFAAIHSSHASVRRGACRYILATPRSAQELVRDISTYSEETLETLRDNVTRLIPVLTLAIWSSDPGLRRNSLDAIRILRLTEIIPDLIGTMFPVGVPQGSDEDRRTERVIETLVYLVGILGESSLNDTQSQEHVGKIVERTASSLDRTLRQIAAKQIPLWMRLFLILYPYLSAHNAAICGVLDDSSHPSYTAIYRFLLSGPVEVVSRFLIDRLQEPEELARTLIGVLSKREDAVFLGTLFNFLANPPDAETVQHHLRRVTVIAWINSLESVLQRSTSEQQCGLVRFLRASSITPDELFTALMAIFEKSAYPAARGAALAAIPLEAPRAIDTTILAALESPEPEIQCAALRQADARKLPGAVSMILTFADSPDARVRETVAELLPSVRFPRFLEVYDSIDAKYRKTFFKKVCSIDSNVPSLMRAILLGRNVADQVKVLGCIIDGDLINQLEDDVAQLAVRGQTEALRIGAIQLLTLGQRTSTRNTLIQILHRDPSEAVRNAAQQALERRPVTM
ncbi:MAG: hypothetical protein ACRC46_07945 [Thermoguttaceae bacterium]